MNDALDKLIAAVEAGDATAGDFMSAFVWRDELGMEADGAIASRAYHGSLDAAKALHDALLPGWGYMVTAHDGEVWREGEYPDTINAQVMGHPARAWLLAILRAYRGTLK